MIFHINPQELDLLMNSLMVKPWHQVNDLITKLLHQANNQDEVAQMAQSAPVVPPLPAPPEVVSDESH